MENYPDIRSTTLTQDEVDSIRIAIKCLKWGYGDVKPSVGFWNGDEDLSNEESVDEIHGVWIMDARYLIKKVKTPYVCKSLLGERTEYMTYYTFEEYDEEGDLMSKEPELLYRVSDPVFHIWACEEKAAFTERMGCEYQIRDSGGVRC